MFVSACIWVCVFYEMSIYVNGTPECISVYMHMCMCMFMCADRGVMSLHIGRGICVSVCECVRVGVWF